MKNGTRSSILRLVDNSGQPVSEGADAFDPSLEHPASAPAAEKEPAESGSVVVTPVLALITVSAACAAAAVAAGSYALWLTRQQAARRALMDVQDILRICQDRMHQMENDLSRLPISLNRD